MEPRANLQLRKSECWSANTAVMVRDKKNIG
jgi:hypothetical protein